MIPRPAELGRVRLATCPSEWYENMLRGRRGGLTPVNVARALKWARTNPVRARAIRTEVVREQRRKGGM